jgi:TolB-like protein
MSFFAELKRRNVVRMAGLYLVGAWLLVQVAGTVLPMFGAPEWLPRSIVVLLAVGFIPALIFSWVFELTPAGLKRDADVAPEESIAPQTARRMDRMIIFVLALALLYFGFDKFVLTARREAALVAATEKSVAARSPAESKSAVSSKSVAVLAFANLSDDKGSEYFSDGISEELLTILQKIPGLHVAARTSAFSFKGKDATAQEIGEKLGVARLVEGSVRKAGDMVRIAARLTQTNTGEEVWSENYTRDLKDVFAVQTELAQTIVEQLRGQLTGGRWLASRHYAGQVARKADEKWEAHQLIQKAAMGIAAEDNYQAPADAWKAVELTEFSPRLGGTGGAYNLWLLATLAVRLGERASTLIWQRTGRQRRKHSRSRPIYRRRCALVRIFNSVLITIGKEQAIRCKQPFAWHPQTRPSSSSRATWPWPRAT